MILLADAMILIDLGYADAIDILPALAPSEVLDVVIGECDHPRQPSLVRSIRSAGITIVRSEVAWVQRAAPYRSPELSLVDSLNLYYAKDKDRVLLTNEKPLRLKCDQYQVQVHGTIWLIEQALEAGLRPTDEVCGWLYELPRLGRRLPKDEITRLADMIGCKSSPER